MALFHLFTLAFISLVDIRGKYFCLLLSLKVAYIADRKVKETLAIKRQRGSVGEQANKLTAVEAVIVFVIIVGRHLE